MAIAACCLLVRCLSRIHTPTGAHTHTKISSRSCSTLFNNAVVGSLTYSWCWGVGKCVIKAHILRDAAYVTECILDQVLDIHNHLNH
jgi:hypothetical protein